MKSCWPYLVSSKRVLCPQHPPQLAFSKATESPSEVTFSEHMLLFHFDKPDLTVCLVITEGTVTPGKGLEFSFGHDFVLGVSQS